jgi:hypothetical protein
MAAEVNRATSLMMHRIVRAAVRDRDRLIVVVAIVRDHRRGQRQGCRKGATQSNRRLDLAGILPHEIFADDRE